MARDSARYYSSKIKEKDYFTENVIAFSECLIFGAQKQTDSLILTTNRIFQLQDSIITSANRENISNSVSDYLLADNHSLTSRKNRAVGILYITVILFILLCIFGIISYRKRLRAKNAAIASKMKELAKLASKYDNGMFDKNELITPSKYHLGADQPKAPVPPRLQRHVYTPVCLEAARKRIHHVLR